MDVRARSAGAMSGRRRRRSVERPALVRSGLEGLPEERELVQRRQPVADRDQDVAETIRARRGSGLGVPLGPSPASVEGERAERAARATLRAQIGKLECELSEIVAERFPFIAAPTAAPGAAGGPCLPGLGELERSRDRLAGRLQELRARAARRSEHERGARELLEKMKLEPGRYKYYRVPVRDLGQGGCGVWEVRPRLGLIGMLAGWWQLTLSSGCPLPRGSRSTRDPAEPG